MSITEYSDFDPTNSATVYIANLPLKGNLRFFSTNYVESVSELVREIVAVTRLHVVSARMVIDGHKQYAFITFSSYDAAQQFMALPEVKVRKAKLAKPPNQVPQQRPNNNRDSSCPAGHPLTLVNGIPPEYSGGWLCDKCSVVLAPTATSVQHCSMCKYDVCPRCRLDPQTQLDGSVPRSRSSSVGTTPGSESVVWVFQSSEGLVPYSSSMCDAAETAFNANQDFYRYEHEGAPYRLDFRYMTQQNLHYSTVRFIYRLVKGVRPCINPHDVVLGWYFSLDSNQLRRLDTQVEKKLEAALCRGDRVVDVVSGDFSYSVSLDKMMQKNKSTGKERRLYRVVHHHDGVDNGFLLSSTPTVLQRMTSGELDCHGKAILTRRPNGDIVVTPKRNEDEEECASIAIRCSGVFPLLEAVLLPAVPKDHADSPAIQALHVIVHTLGLEVYGGAIRDYLLRNTEPQDIDVLVTRPERGDDLLKVVEPAFTAAGFEVKRSLDKLKVALRITIKKVTKDSSAKGIEVEFVNPADHAGSKMDMSFNNVTLSKERGLRRKTPDGPPLALTVWHILHQRGVVLAVEDSFYQKQRRSKFIDRQWTLVNCDIVTLEAHPVDELPPEVMPEDYSESSRFIPFKPKK